MTIEEIDAQLALANAATSGPWQSHHERRSGVWGEFEVVAFNDSATPMIVCSTPIADDDAKNDAAFIASARTTLPKALEALKRVLALGKGRCSDPTCGYCGTFSMADIRRAISGEGAE